MKPMSRTDHTSTDWSDDPYESDTVPSMASNGHNGWSNI